MLTLPLIELLTVVVMVQTDVPYRNQAPYDPFEASLVQLKNNMQKSMWYQLDFIININLPE